MAQTGSGIVDGLGLALTERISTKDVAVQKSKFLRLSGYAHEWFAGNEQRILATDNHPSGAGEKATPLAAPAISNAVAQLYGVRLRESPMTPSE